MHLVMIALAIYLQLFSNTAKLSKVGLLMRPTIGLMQFQGLSGSVTVPVLSASQELQQCQSYLAVTTKTPAVSFSWHFASVSARPTTGECKQGLIIEIILSPVCICQSNEAKQEYAIGPAAWILQPN